MAKELDVNQGAQNIREIESPRPALPYDYAYFADGTTFE